MCFWPVWLSCGIGGRALLRAEMKKKVGTDCLPLLGHVNGFRFSSKGNRKLVKVKNKGDVGQRGTSGEKGLKAVWILELELLGLADGLDMEVEGK